MTARQRLKVPKRLSLFQDTKSKSVVGQRHVNNVVRSHLDEYSTRRSALMKLSSRMQKARPVPGRRGDMNRIAQVSSNRLNQLLVLRRLLNIVQQRNVVACIRSLEVRGDEAINCDTRPNLLDRLGVTVGPQTASFRTELLVGKGTVLLVDFKEVLGVVL